MCEEFQEIVTHRDMRSIIQCYAERITDTKDDITRLVSYALFDVSAYGTD